MGSMDDVDEGTLYLLQRAAGRIATELLKRECLQPFDRFGQDVVKHESAIHQR